jgi:hypothetical protein
LVGSAQLGELVAEQVSGEVGKFAVVEFELGVWKAEGEALVYDEEPATQSSGWRPFQGCGWSGSGQRGWLRWWLGHFGPLRQKLKVLKLEVRAGKSPPPVFLYEYENKWVAGKGYWNLLRTKGETRS